MTDASIPADIANGPVAPRFAWLLSYVRNAGGELTEDEIAANFSPILTGQGAFKTALSETRGALAGFELRGMRTPNPQLVAVATLEADGHAWDIGIQVEAEPPHRIYRFSRAERVPGIEIRTATDDDAGKLRQIELETPIMLGDTGVVYDRGDDYFAAERLMGDAVTHIIELHGRPVGLTSWILNPVRVGDRSLIAAYKHRTRLLADARGQGLRQMLDFAGFEGMSWRSHTFYTFAAAGNAAVRKAYGEPRWRVQPERIVIDTARHAGPDAGRRATVEDSARIIEMLNHAHSSEELYEPYTAESLAARLGREPKLYSWPQVRMGERAVVGVWPAGLRVIRTTAGDTTHDVRALVLDYGYEEGGEDELIALLRAECARLAASGTTELTIFTTAQSAAYAGLATIAKRAEPYLMWIGIVPPADAAKRGIYVDQLYF